MNAPANKPPPRTALIVCTQRIGDVLLATPLSRSIKQKWPDCAVDFLVLPGTQGVLEGNPDVRHVLLSQQRVGIGRKLALLWSLRNRYDMALATIASDRARLHAWMAAPVRVGFVHASESQLPLKRALLTHAVDFDDLDTHTVSMNLQLAEVLGLPLCTEVVPPRSSKPLPAPAAALLGSGLPYAVLHPSPKFAYKMWTVEGWQQLGYWLQTQGLRVILTGSPDLAETAYVQTIAQGIGSDCLNLSGQLSLGQSTHILEAARIYIGPDTAMTHMAASTGVPTIALFGPSNPVKWGPWPRAQCIIRSPWKSKGSQRQGNVSLIQGPGDCVPCLLEGCDRHEQSVSRCLQQIAPHSLIEAAHDMLSARPMSPSNSKNSP